MVPWFLMRRWFPENEEMFPNSYSGNEAIFAILFKSSENGEMDPWFLMTGYEEMMHGRSSWQPVTEFSHFPESFVPPSTTAGTVLSLYFFILLDIYEIGILSLNMLY